MNGTNRFKTGSHGLTDIPAKFRNAMDYLLLGLKNIFGFLDDVFIDIKGSEDQHIILVIECPAKLDSDGLRINLPQCHS